MDKTSAILQSLTLVMGRQNYISATTPSFFRNQNCNYIKKGMQRLFLTLMIFFFNNWSFGQVDKKISSIQLKIKNINSAITPDSCSFKIKKITNDYFLKVSNEGEGVEQELYGYYDKEKIKLISYDIRKLPYINTTAYYFSDNSLISVLEVQQVLPSFPHSIGTSAKFIYTSIYYLNKGKVIGKDTKGKKIFLANKPRLTEKIIIAEVRKLQEFLNQ